MKSLRSTLCFLGLLATALVFAGCAHYRNGSMMHPQIHTIYIAPLKNDTMQPRLEIIAKSKIRSAFAKDGSLLVVDKPEDADCILRARVKNFAYSSEGSTENRSTDKDQQVYVTSIFGVAVSLEYEVELPDRDRPLVSTRIATGKADFTSLPDHDILRNDAFELAVADAATSLVYGVTEAW